MKLLDILQKNLTLTSVVFELNKHRFYKSTSVHLTLTSVVFELVKLLKSMSSWAI